MMYQKQGDDAHHFVILTDHRKLVEYCILGRGHTVRPDLQAWLTDNIPASVYRWWELQATPADGSARGVGYGMLLTIESDEYATLFKLTWG